MNPLQLPASPVVRELLRDGSLRLRSATCAMVLTRLRPGVMRMTIAGEDDGAFGDLPLIELDAEHARFGAPLELLVDAEATTRAAVAVSRAWARWFVARRGVLRRVTMLVHERSVAMGAAIARHLSDTARVMTITTDPEVFRAAVARAAPELADAPRSRWLDALAVPVARDTTPDGAVRLVGDGCAFEFTRLRPAVLRVTITGHDAGQLGALALDEARQLARAAAPNPLELFVDGSGVSAIDAHVSAQWTAWLAAHPEAVARAHIFAASDAVRLHIALAREVARLADRVRLYRDRAVFEAALARAA